MAILNLDSVIDWDEIFELTVHFKREVIETDHDHEPVFLLKSKVLIIVSKRCRLQKLRALVVFEHQDLLDRESKDDRWDEHAQASTCRASKAWATLMKIERKWLTKLVKLQHFLRIVTRSPSFIFFSHWAWDFTVP